MRYFFGFLIAIGLIIFIIILMFGGGGKSKADLLVTGKVLESFSTSDAQVSLTIDGPVNADQTHQQVKITVDNTEVVYQQISGYNGSVVNSQVYPNTEASYYNFLRAIGFGGFQHGDTDKTMRDERGRCPLGSRYIFDMNQDGNSLEHFWATTCSIPKTYLGNLPGVVQLFQQQVPDYSTLTSDLQILPQ